MKTTERGENHRLSPRPLVEVLWTAFSAIALLMATQFGCAISSAKHAVPATRVPEVFLAETRSDLVPINYALLGQTPPATHMIAPGDTIGVYVHSILPPQQDAAPMVYQRSINEGYYPANGSLESPSMGVPMEVQVDGTIPVPLVDPVQVAGMTLADARKAIGEAYVKKELIQEGRERVLVSLVRARVHRILVVREDSQTDIPTMLRKDATIYTKKGHGEVVDLPTFENDVLHALTVTGGLPGIDAHNKVWVLRSGQSSEVAFQAAGSLLQNCENPHDAFTSMGCKERICIPLKIRSCDPIPFSQQDIVLNDGDVVYVEPRIEDVFYTGGLLPGGSIPLPRDHDLDVIEAIALANGSTGGPGGSSGVAVFRAGAGPGNIVPPTRVIILRRLANGQQLPIRVDLVKAMHDVNERILIQPEDVVMLHFKPQEQFSNVLLNFFDFNVSLSDAFK